MSEASKTDGGEDLEINTMRRLTLGAVSLAVLIFVYFVLADRYTPFAADARIQAYVLNVAPEVSGRVSAVAVTDNEIVEPGGLLFRIEQTTYELAVEKAQARLDQVGQDIGASTASVDAAQARVHEAKAVFANVEAQSARDLELVKKGILAKARADDANAALAQAKAGVDSAMADLRRAQEELGPGGAEDPKVRDALADLERARFDLSRTEVRAPSRGVVTNLQLAGGQTVNAGQAAMTFISGDDVWLLANMRENSIEPLEAGQSVDIVFDALPGRVFAGAVQSIGWGVADNGRATNTGLATTGAEEGWLGDSQRFPVRIVIEDRPLPAGPRYGSRAAVLVYAGGNPIMNAVGWLRMRVIALLTYVS